MNQASVSQLRSLSGYL